MIHLVSTIPAGTADLPSWIAPAALITVAILGLGGVVLGVILRKPTTEVELRERQDKSDAKIEILYRNQRVMFGAFDGIYSAITRTTGVPKLTFIGDEEKRVEAGKHLVYGDAEWPTVEHAQ